MRTLTNNINKTLPYKVLHLFEVEIQSTNIISTPDIVYAGNDPEGLYFYKNDTGLPITLYKDGTNVIIDDFTGTYNYLWIGETQTIADQANLEIRITEYTQVIPPIFKAKTVEDFTDYRLRFTDNDVFAIYGTNLYIPLSITFNDISEDTAIQSEKINISFDNLNGDLTAMALQKEWRNNNFKIYKVFYPHNTFSQTDPSGGLAPSEYLAPSETLAPAGADLIPFDYGLGETFTDYPKVDLDGIASKDIWLIYDGLVDTFNATEGIINISLINEMSRWNKPIGTRTFNQGEFQTIINAMTEEISWK